MKIKLGIIGYRNQAAKLLSILQNKQDVTVKSIFHPDKKIDDPRFTNDFKDILDSDAVIIASPNHTHFEYIKKLTKKSQGRLSGGKGISLINTQIGETNVELNISGNISVQGALVFEEKDLITTNLRESKTWDLEIEQTQRFNIDGNIGDRFFVKIKQDSEADFTWENDLTIEYKGQKNDILQKAEAGNINLSLEGMDAVTLGGANSSLFGIKLVSQLGPVEIQSVVAREQVKKSEKT